MVADASTNDFQNRFHSVLTLSQVRYVPARVVRKQVRQLNRTRIMLGMEGDYPQNSLQFVSLAGFLKT